MGRDLRLVAFSMLLWGSGEGLFLYFQPVYLQQLGATPLQIGVILGVSAIVLMGVHIPAGMLADRIGRKETILMSSIIGILAAWGMFAARSVLPYACAMAVYSATALILAPLSSYASAARGDWTISRALTSIWAAYTAGAVAGPVVGGLLAQSLGLRVLYGIGGSIFVFSTVLVGLVKRQPVEPTRSGDSSFALLRDRSIWRYLVLFFFAMLAMYLGVPLTPIYLHAVRSIRISLLGVFGSLSYLGTVATSLVLGRLSPRRSFVIAEGMVAASAFLLWQGRAVPLLGTGSLLVGAVRTAHFLVAPQIDEIVPRGQMGLAFGAAETAVYAGVAVASPVAGLLYGVGPGLPLLLSGCLTVVVLAATAFARPGHPLAEGAASPKAG
ncbi:MAG: MFS transporter [Anaerolineales bacterium]|jgi:MFS family permease